MCVVSMIHDYTRERLPDFYPNAWPSESARVLALEQEIKDIKELLRRAKLYDIENDQPDCPSEEKIEMIKKLCKELNIHPEELIEV